MGSLAEDGKKVLVIDDDRDVAELVQTILIDEGFRVSCLYDPASLPAVLDVLEPDCILLDGGFPSSFGPSWDVAAHLADRPRRIPTVMLTGHIAAREEATLDDSARARAARFVAVIPKPFDIDRLITIVRHAVGEDVPMLSDRAEADNAKALIEPLREAGAQDLQASKLGRVWVTFRTADGTLYKVYRWRAADAWFVGRYDPTGRQLAPLAQFGALPPLIAFCKARINEARPADRGR